MLAQDGIGRLLLNPAAFPAESGQFVELTNNITGLKVQVGALINLLIARGLITEAEWASNLSREVTRANMQFEMWKRQQQIQPPAPTGPGA